MLLLAVAVEVPILGGPQARLQAVVGKAVLLFSTYRKEN
jgi:hypothetical protein